MKEREKWKHYGQYSSNCFTLCVCKVVSVFNTRPFVHLLSDFTIRDHGMCMNCSTREEQSAEVSGPYPYNTPSHIPLWLARSFLSENVFCLDSEMNPCVCKPKQFKYTTPSCAHTCLYTPLSHSNIPLSHTLQTLLFLIHTLLSLLHTHPPLTLFQTLPSHILVPHAHVTHHTELYEYCLNEGYADKNLIAKWKKVSPHGT